MRDELKSFYQEMQEWVEAGCPTHDHFETDIGLCGNLHTWAEENYDSDTADELWDVQKALFVLAELDIDFPFDAHCDAYFKAGRAGDGLGLYTNEQRLNWIKEHAQ